MKYLLKNGTVISGTGGKKLDVLVEGEKIIRVGESLFEQDAKVVDVTGKLLFPGFIDGHTHFDLEVAGTVTADDFETGTRAAILGGTTLVIDFASQDKGGHTLKEGLIWMERVLVPIAEKLSRMLLVMPLPRPTMTMTAMTPMMMPSMVRNVRSLLLQTFCSAWRKVSNTIILLPPVPLRRTEWAARWPQARGRCRRTPPDRPPDG